MKNRLYPALCLIAITVLWLAACTPPPTAPTARVKQWSTAPAMQIDVNKSYSATLHTVKGDIVIEFYPKSAPLAVNNFIFLARQGYFDGVTFHRVLPGFVAQGGDPTGSGMGSPGYKFANEIDPALTFDAPGIVAMANAGPDTNGSQFFITYAPLAQLNGGYTIFGHVTSGMDVANNLTPRDPSQNPNAPPGDAITSVSITEK
jgi:cyclophilin family peptidyl-prolyl cis-trans isomerase